MESRLRWGFIYLLTAPPVHHRAGTPRDPLVSDNTVIAAPHVNKATAATFRST